MEDHDTQILAALRSGEEAALITFLQTNREVLLAFIRSRTGSQLQKKVEPEDVLQEVSIEAVRVLAQTDLLTWDPLNWLFQLCQRKILDAHRRYFASKKRDAGREIAPAAGERSGRTWRSAGRQHDNSQCSVLSRPAPIADDGGARAAARRPTRSAASALPGGPTLQGNRSKAGQDQWRHAGDDLPGTQPPAGDAERVI